MTNPPVPPPPEPVQDEPYVPSRLRSNKVLRGLFNAFILALCGYGVHQFATWYSEYDYWLYWFIVLATWRYARFILNCIGWVLYKPTPVPKNPTYTPNRHVTVILPTIDPTGVDFQECISTCAQNEPAQIIVITAGDELLVKTEKAVEKYIKLYPKTNFIVDRALIASKRAQVAVAVPLVSTAITVMLDDHVFWKKDFLKALLAPFEDPEIGLVGTNKKVRRLPNLSVWRRFWNMLGATYLYRHNFEVRSANYWDGGSFVISARTCALRTRIVQDPEYLAGYVDERFFFGLCGPLNPDDDNYNTRFAVRKGWRIKFQYTDDAEIETTVGVADPVHKKFLGQCTRWARTTWRSNPCSLFTDGSVWAFQPYCVYAVYLTSFTNFALFTDVALVALYNWSKQATSQGIWALVIWILFVKFVKVFEYYKRHPNDWWTFPFYVAFAYYHSLIKLWALLTFWDHAWTGRNLGAIKTQANPAGTEAGATAGPAAVAARLQRSMSVSSMTSSLAQEKEGLRSGTAWISNLGSTARLHKSQTIFGGSQVGLLDNLKIVGSHMEKSRDAQVRILGQQDIVFNEVQRLIAEADSIEKQYETMNDNETRNQEALIRLRGQMLRLEQRHGELIRIAGLTATSPALTPTAAKAFKVASRHHTGGGRASPPTEDPESIERPSFFTGVRGVHFSRSTVGGTSNDGFGPGRTGADGSGSNESTPRPIIPDNFKDSFPPDTKKSTGDTDSLIANLNIPTIGTQHFVPPSEKKGGQPAAAKGFPPPTQAEKPIEEFSPVPQPRNSPSGFTPTSDLESTTPGEDPAATDSKKSSGSDSTRSPAQTPTRPPGGRRVSKEQNKSVSTPPKQEEAAPLNKPRTPESNPLLKEELEQQNHENSMRRFYEMLGES